MKPDTRLLSSTVGFVVLFALVAGAGSGLLAQRRSQAVVTPDDPIWAAPRIRRRSLRSRRRSRQAPEPIRRRQQRARPRRPRQPAAPVHPGHHQRGADR